jgi:ppGpp synthetase/RelA/SpoT-type nucleotidyltranferase
VQAALAAVRGSDFVPISDDVIRKAVDRYDRERDRYLKLASRVADICRTSVVEEHAVRAQITSRTKTVRSFEGKLRRFAKRPDKNFATVDEIFEKIGDFAGVRVATYRPEDESRVAQAISGLFAGFQGATVDVDLKDKLDPANCQFYRATHCQVFLKEEELLGDYANLKGASCEIQICSMMAHVWNEIEHDIGYKPEGGGPAEAERGLLEVLGHLTRSGDAAITQLLAANTARMTAQTGDFSDVHEFVARLSGRFPDADLSVNAGQAFDEASRLGLMSIDSIERDLGEAALDPDVAKGRIGAFNAYLTNAGQSEWLLNPGSSDLVLMGLLEAHLAEIEAAHRALPPSTRPTRVSYLVRHYRDFQNAEMANPVEPAA